MQSQHALNPRSRSLCRALALSAAFLCLSAPPAIAGEQNVTSGQSVPVLVEVRHAPPVEGKTPVTLKAKVPLTLTFRALNWGDAGFKPGKVTATHRLKTGETCTFIHDQPMDAPVQAVCAQPKSGPERCWMPLDDESDDGGRFIMAPGFVLKN